MTVTNPASEYEALVHIVERIAWRFPEVPESQLFDMVAEELVRFDRARLRAYVPAIVEGNVLRALRAREATALAS
ncbi:three-helix bundle dimerization domain-containing protein [Microbacterium sp. SLBN-146]|uniref:three-helix bundle dimerization domain-containing protein n=1 Tax=Microbacterium sp. SLBN-146 TaxID=2768457 RepID=UPI001150B95E|nr:hypothetical protein [Microbacterium sp. SLBN-146]